MSSSVSNLQQLINAVTTEGATYGLEINWTKTFQMSICTNSQVTRPDNTVLENKRGIVYLGGMISCDGRAARELTRRVNEGRSIFLVMMKLWSHANINGKRNIEIFNSCITSKVMCSLESLWLLQANKDRLNTCQCWCLRRIMRIAPSFISRVSNVNVCQGAC